MTHLPIDPTDEQVRDFIVLESETGRGVLPKLIRAAHQAGVEAERARAAAETTEITDAMVEAAARSLFNGGQPDEDDTTDPDQLSWSSMAEDDKSRADLYRDDARRILADALGAQS